MEKQKRISTNLPTIILVLTMTSSVVMCTNEESDVTLNGNTEYLQLLGKLQSANGDAHLDDVIANQVDRSGTVASELGKRWNTDNGSRIWGKRNALTDQTRMKRSWNEGLSRLWGKRTIHNNNLVTTNKRWTSQNTGNRIWGKRDDVIDSSIEKKWSDRADSRLWGKRAQFRDDSSSDLMADRRWAGSSPDSRVWGKRGWGDDPGRFNWGKRDGAREEEKRAWANKDRIEWGKRKERSTSLDDVIRDGLTKRGWYASYKRQWGKRAADQQNLGWLATLGAVRGWGKIARVEGEKDDY